MAIQRIIMTDKNVERAINSMFQELYGKVEFLSKIDEFKSDYDSASTTDEKLKVVAEFLQLL